MHTKKSMTRVRRSVFVVMMDLTIVLRVTRKFFLWRKRIARSFKKKKKKKRAERCGELRGRRRRQGIHRRQNGVRERDVVSLCKGRKSGNGINKIK